MAVCTLGLNEGHDAGAALCRDGGIVLAIAEERLSRVKHDAGFPRAAVEYVLSGADVKPGEVRCVVRCRPAGASDGLDEECASDFLAPFLRGGVQVYARSHHRMHAASAFYASGWTDAGILVCDAAGSPAGRPGLFEGETLYRASGAGIHCLLQRPVAAVDCPRGGSPSFAGLYGLASRYVFESGHDAGKLMALGAYGHSPDPGESFIRPGGDGLYEVNRERLDRFSRRERRTRNSLRFSGLARTLQTDMETYVLALVRRLRGMCDSGNLCLAGGLFLNCPLNTRIRESGLFRNVFIFPAATDDGVAVGAALHAYYDVLGGRRTVRTAFSPYAGRRYGEAETRKAIGEWTRANPDAGTARFADGVELLKSVAELLLDGKVVAFFQGGSEFGPRALGNRSMLAMPHKAEMRDRINAELKGRESFRPFAPAVVRERAGEFFLVDDDFESPCMMYLVKARPEKAAALRGVVHRDGTARAQTVTKEQNPALHALLTMIGGRSGVPVLLNTSLNAENEPIVETPGDALDLFSRIPLDALALGDWLIRRRK